MAVLSNLKNIYLAKLTKDDATGVTYGTVTKLANAAISVSAKPTIQTDDLYAGGQKSETEQTFDSVEVELTIKDANDEQVAEMGGHTIDATSGKMICKTTDIAPYYALGFEAVRNDGSQKCVWLTKGKFEPAEDNLKTKEKNATFQPLSFKGSFQGRDFDSEYRISLDSRSAKWAAGTNDDTVFFATGPVAGA